VITAEETAREKKRLPRGWGRFGKALEHLTEISDRDESLLSSCVGLNPKFRHTAFTLEGNLVELTKSTNIILAATDQRLLVVATGAGGAPRSHRSIPYEGLEIVAVSKKDLTLRWPEGEMHVRGIAKQLLPDFVDALSTRLGKPPG
jgi:hypothetical protein